MDGRPVQRQIRSRHTITSLPCLHLLLQLPLFYRPRDHLLGKWDSSGRYCWGTLGNRADHCHYMCMLQKCSPACSLGSSDAIQCCTVHNCTVT